MGYTLVLMNGLQYTTHSLDWSLQYSPFHAKGVRTRAIKQKIKRVNSCKTSYFALLPNPCDKIPQRLCNSVAAHFPINMHDLSQWNFYISMRGKNAYLDCILKICNCDNNFVEYFQYKYKRRIAPDLA